MLENECHHLDLKIGEKMTIKNHELDEKDFNIFYRITGKFTNKISKTENKIEIIMQEHS